MDDSVPMDLENLPYTQSEHRRNPHTKSRGRASCPPQPNKVAREQAFEKQRYGMKRGRASEPYQVQKDLGNLKVDSVRSPSVRERGFSNFNTPLGSTHHSQMEDSPMEVDPSTPDQSQSRAEMEGVKAQLWSVADELSQGMNPSYKSQARDDELESTYSDSIIGEEKVSNTISALDAISDDDDGEPPYSQSTKSRSTKPRAPSNRLSENQTVTKCCGSFLRLLFIVVFIGSVGVWLVGFTVEYRQRLCDSNQGLNVSGIKNTLDGNVYGQHIALDLVTSALDTFVKENQPRTLVMSFHGWTGIGKTFVSTLISQHIVTPSTHKIIIPMHFPHKEHDEVYESEIHHWITSNVSSCAVNLFIIDEMDKATPGVVLGVESAIKNLHAMPLNTSRVLLILLSNTGGASINKNVYRHLEGGQERSGLVASGLVSSLLEGSDARWIKMLHDHGLVDHIVPFLPLEMRHVQLCIEAYVRESPFYRGAQVDMDRLLREFVYLPKDNPLFSKTGCRKVTSVVNMMVDSPHAKSEL